MEDRRPSHYDDRGGGRSRSEFRENVPRDDFRGDFRSERRDSRSGFREIVPRDDVRSDFRGSRGDFRGSRDARSDVGESRGEFRGSRDSRSDFVESRGEFRGSRDSRSDFRGERGEGEQDLPELYSICKGKVHSIKPFGIFVRLDVCRAHGLVHLSHVSRHEVTQREDSDEVKMQALAAIVGQGDEVWVKIISVKREEGKIGCSMKLVKQSDGTDLDPNNVQLESQESRPAYAARQSKVALDAVYDAQCSRCGGHGHLKSECYSTGGKVYELLPEEEVVIDQQETERVAIGKETTKEMMHGSSKKKRASSSSSRLPESVTTVEEAKALIAGLKEEKKRKKKEREEDSDRKHHKKKKKKKEKRQKNRE